MKEFVISCSGSGKDSLVVRDIDDKKRKTYTFKVAKVNTISTGVEKMLTFCTDFVINKTKVNNYKCINCYSSQGKRSFENWGITLKYSPVLARTYSVTRRVLTNQSLTSMGENIICEYGRKYNL